jgi:YbgC/YbaW family acyl-CoA thioester hydrolase
MHIHKATFRHQVTFSDCDPAHLAYYPRMMEWFDWSTEHLFRSVDLHWEKMFMHDGMGGMPLLDISVQFTYPCRFGDHIAITTWIDAFEGRRFTVKHELKNGPHDAGRCREYRAWVMLAPESPRGIRAVPVPEEIRRKFHREA